MNSSIQKLVTVINPLGLHMRPAHLLSKAAAQFECEIELEKDGQAIDCKSIMSLLTLCAQQGTQLQLRASGQDAQQAVDLLTQLFEKGFDEFNSEVSPSTSG